MKSIIQHGKYCIITKETTGLHKHHCLNGVGLRDFSERNGLWVYLHYSVHDDLHNGKNLYARELKRVAQYCYLQSHTLEEWMMHVRKNYLSTPFTEEEAKKYGLIKTEAFDITKDNLDFLEAKHG